MTLTFHPSVNYSVFREEWKQIPGHFLQQEVLQVKLWTAPGAETVTNISSTE